MKLSTRTRYATLALFDIAFHSRGEPTQVRQIAERQEIPLRFLEQILQGLKRAEIVEGRRGRHGGYVLRRPASEITLLDVMQATDGPVEASFCQAEDRHADARGPCPRSSRCLPALMWEEVSAEIAAVLSRFSIAEIVTRAEAAGIPRGDETSCYMYFI